MKVLLFVFLFLEISSIVIPGIDVSTHQNSINWNTVAKTQHFAIIRAGYGNDNVDDYFEINYKGAKAAGLKVGAYWYSYATDAEGAKREAKAFMKHLAGKKFEWPVYYDIEEKSIFNNNAQNTLAKTFCDLLEANNYFCGIYASAYPLRDNFDSSVKNRYAIWVAHYGVSKPLYTGSYGIWQKEIGYVNGVNGEVDIDEGYIDYEPIMKENGLNGFQKGSSGDDTTDTTEPTYQTYVVKAGDNLTNIAKKLGVTVDYLVSVNNISNPNLIYVGQVLYY